MKYDVFISKNNKDAQYANYLVNFLERNGLRVFESGKSLPNMGDADYGDKIDESLENSENMLVVISPNELGSGKGDFSRWVHYEWTTFRNECLSKRKDGNLITVICGNITIDQLPLGLRKYEAFEFDSFENSDILEYLKKDNTGLLYQEEGLYLELKRISAKENYTIGHLFVNGEQFCDTLEKTDRGLRQDMSLEELCKRKVSGETAIPTGTYKISMGHRSPKFSMIDYYRDFCDGYMPRLLRVPAFEGILIHRGNWKEATEGCLLVGENTTKGGLARSKYYWERLMLEYLIPARQKDTPITITITADYNTTAKRDLFT